MIEWWQKWTLGCQECLLQVIQHLVESAMNYTWGVEMQKICGCKTLNCGGKVPPGQICSGRKECILCSGPRKVICTENFRPISTMACLTARSTIARFLFFYVWVKNVFSMEFSPVRSGCSNVSFCTACKWLYGTIVQGTELFLTLVINITCLIHQLEWWYYQNSGTYAMWEFLESPKNPWSFIYCLMLCINH